VGLHDGLPLGRLPVGQSAALTYPLKPPYAGEYPATSHLGEIEICGPPRSYGFVHTSLGSIGVCLYIANK